MCKKCINTTKPIEKHHLKSNLQNLVNLKHAKSTI